jgi:23S rRNA (guanosine2251-2'-O)-methyltransferase
MLTLRNPHAVLAAFDTRPRDVVEVRLPEGRAQGAWDRVVAEAARHGCLVVPVARDARTGRDGGRSGAEALVREREPVALDRLFAGDHARGLWLALDGVQDPHNAGAIFRAAAFFGVRGIVLTADRSVGLTPVVYDVSSGGMEAVPHAVETNLRRALQAAKDAGIWILGSSEHAKKDVTAIQADRPWLLVLGNEETGLRRLTLETCDEVCRVTPRGSQVTSLNVGVAAGILMAALTR